MKRRGIRKKALIIRRLTSLRPTETGILAVPGPSRRAGTSKTLASNGDPDMIRFIQKYKQHGLGAKR